MTPAEQIRATMALLEGIAESKSAVDLVSSMAQQAANEFDGQQVLDEGLAKNTIAALLTTAAMAFSAGSQAANFVNDSICAGTLSVASGALKAQGHPQADNFLRWSKQFAERAQSNANRMKAYSTAESTMIESGKRANRMIAQGQWDQLQSVVVDCLQNQSAGLGSNAAPARAAQPAQQVDQQSAGEAAFDRWESAVKQNRWSATGPESRQLFKSVYSTLKTQEARDAFEDGFDRTRALGILNALKK